MEIKILFGLLIGVVLISGCIQVSEKEKGTILVTIDPKIIEGLEAKDKVPAIIVLGDSSDLAYTQAKTDFEEFQIYQDKKEINGAVQSEVLATLTDLDFEVSQVSESGRWISGSINKEIIKILSEDPIIKAVYSPKNIKQEILEESPNISKEFLKQCFQDSDCVKVDTNCCGCNMGGKATTVNKKYVEYWDDKLKEECLNIFCTAEISNHPSCFEEPKCINDRCRLENEEELEIPEEGTNYSLGVLIIEFNGLTQKGLIAVTSLGRTKQNPGGELNVAFKEYFSNDLDSLALEFDGISDIEILYWLRASDKSSIEIKFNDELSNEEKGKLLDDIKTQLESKWYVGGAYHESILFIAI